MIFAIVDLKNALHRKDVLLEEIAFCKKAWGFVDDQLMAELALAQCEIDWSVERIIKSCFILTGLFIVGIVVYHFCF